MVVCARHDPQRSGLPFTATSAKVMVMGGATQHMFCPWLTEKRVVAVAAQGSNSIDIIISTTTTIITPSSGYHEKSTVDHIYTTACSLH